MPKPHEPTLNPSFVKELAKPTQEKLFLKNFPTLQKNKKHHAQPDKDRQKSKLTMTLKPNTDNGLQEGTTEHQLPTTVWRNGGGRGKMNSSFSNQHLCLLDSEVLRMPPLRQAAKRCLQYKCDHY